MVSVRTVGDDTMTDEKKDPIDLLNKIRGDIERLALEHGEALLPLQDSIQDLEGHIKDMKEEMHELEKKAITQTDLDNAIEDALGSMRLGDVIAAITEIQEHIARKENGAVGLMFTTVQHKSRRGY
tara:strand:+ start:138 stop:515 length:378 start_codon:yes stop_codon:yes gene_type:complete